MSASCCSSPSESLQNLDSIDCLPERSMAVLNIAGLHTFSFPDPSLCNDHHKANVESCNLRPSNLSSVVTALHQTSLPLTSLSLASLKTPMDNVNVQNNILESSVLSHSNESHDFHCSSRQIIHSVTESVCNKHNAVQAMDSVHITLNPLTSSVTNVSSTSFIYPQIPPNSGNCVHYRAIQPMIIPGDLSSIAMSTNHLTSFGELRSVKSEKDGNIFVNRDVGNAYKSLSGSRAVGDYISVIKCELDTIDSHIDNAIITVNERNAPNVRDCHTPLENNLDNYFNEKSGSVTSWSKFVTSPSDVMDGSVSDVMDLNDPASPVAARTYTHDGVSGTHSNFVDFPESDSFDNEEGSLLSMPMYQNFFCIICGKSEIICEQNSLDNSLAGSAKVLVIDVLVRILNTDEGSLYKRSTKICIMCYKVIDEIEYLKEALDKKETVVKHMFNETSTCVDKIETDECCDKSRNNFFDKTEKNLVQLKRNSYIRNNLDLINAPLVHNNKDDVEDGSDAVVMNKISKKCKQYRCFRCNAGFKTAHERKTHMRLCQIRVLEERKSTNITEKTNDTVKLNDKIAHSKKKSIKTHACEQCSETFNSRNSLLTHAANHQTSFDCHVCGRYLTTKARLLAHLFKFHGIGIGKSKSERCDRCDKSFQTKAGLSYHKNVAHQVGTKYVCEHCQKVYYYHVPYKSHMLFAHGKKKVVCETCGEMFFTVSKLNTHINAVHRNAKTWQCVECDVKFTTGTAFRQHNLVQHHNTRHACEYCTAQYRKKSALYAHLREHSIYKCRSCRDVFTDEHLYNVHISAVHNQVPPKISKKRVSASGASVHQRKSGIRASIARPRNNRGGKVSTSSLPSHLQPINLNDLLLTNSYNSNNLQVFGTVPSDKLSSVNLSDSTGKMRSFNLLNQEAGLDMDSGVNCLTIDDGVPFIDEEILDSIEISASRTELSADGSHVHERLSSSMVDISNLDNLPPHVTAFEETDSSVVDCLVKQTVDGIHTSVTDLDSNVPCHHHHISHADLGSTIHDLAPSVNELSPPNDNINSSVDLDQVVEDIEPSVHNLDSSVKSIDHSTIWAMLKGGSHEENLQSIPSSAIDDLDIGGVIDGAMVDVQSTMVVSDGTMDDTVVVEDNSLVDADSVLVVCGDVLSNAGSPLGLGMSVNVTEGDSEELDVLNVDITC